MAIKTDMSKAKRKWEEEAKREASRNKFGRPTKYWKPKVGTNRIRILPPWTTEGPNDHQWWREVWKHYGVVAANAPDENNEFTVLCPKKTDDAWHHLDLPPGTKPDCKVCEHIFELQEAGEAALATSMKAQIRFLMNIVDLSDPVWTKEQVEELKLKNVPENALPKAGSPKIQVFEAGSTIMKDILDFYNDNVDLADLDSGHDITIERTGMTKTDTKYRTRPTIKPSKAEYVEDADLVNLNNLDTVATFLTDEQVQMILDGGTREEVFALSASPKSETKQLAAKSAKEEVVEESAEEETTEEKEESSVVVESDDILARAEAVEEEETEEEGSEETAEWELPVDAEGYIDYENISDEQIEDPNNAKFKDKHGYSVHVDCFGKARQRNENDPNCSENCGMFERCGKRIAFLDQQEAKAKAKTPPKRGPGKKPAPEVESAPAPAAKKAAGKPVAKEAPAPSGEVLSLEEEMKRALAASA